MDRSSVFRRLIRIFQPILILAAIGLVYYLGIHSERTGFVRQVLDPGLKRFTLPVLNAFRGRPPEVRKLVIHIDGAVMDSLSAIRDRAMEAGVLDEGKDRWFPALLEWAGDTLSAQLRLKGGLTDHLRTHKWSYRIQLSPGDTVAGMNTFSIHHPNTRNFSYEWVFHRALRDQGLPFVLYDFIDVEINGDDLGLYAIEQHFDSALLARLGLHGPVIKFDDEARIGTLKEMNERRFSSDPPLQGEWQSAPIEAFHTREVLEDPVTSARFHAAVRSLEDFRQGRKPTAGTFDAPLLAHLFALSDLLGGQHANDWRNLRFVPDSAGNRLLPIGFDANAGEPIEAIRALREQGPLRFDARATGFYDRLFSDTLFYRAYINSLEAVSAPGWLEGLMDRLAPDLEAVERVVRAEFPNAVLDTNVFLHDRTVIRQTLHPQDVALAYVQVDSSDAVLLVANVQALPIRVKAILSGDQRIPIPRMPVIPPRARDASINYRRIALPAEVDAGAKLKAVITIMGLPQEYIVPIRPWSPT